MLLLSKSSRPVTSHIKFTIRGNCHMSSSWRLHVLFLKHGSDLTTAGGNIFVTYMIYLVTEHWSIWYSFIKVTLTHNPVVICHWLSCLLSRWPSSRWLVSRISLFPFHLWPNRTWVMHFVVQRIKTLFLPLLHFDYYDWLMIKIQEW